MVEEEDGSDLFPVGGGEGRPAGVEESAGLAASGVTLEEEEEGGFLQVVLGP